MKEKDKCNNGKEKGEILDYFSKLKGEREMKAAKMSRRLGFMCLKQASAFMGKKEHSTLLKIKRKSGKISYEYICTYQWPCR